MSYKNYCKNEKKLWKLIRNIEKKLIKKKLPTR